MDVFLDSLRDRNPALLRTAIALHRSGDLPANTYVVDLDTVQANAAVIATEAARLGLEAFAMTKQVGRAPGFARAAMAGGIDAGVAVDMACARALAGAGMPVGHVGHLVQVPTAETAEAASYAPWNWTVFNDDRARLASEAAVATGREQPLLARIHAPGDEFYPGHEGGYPADEIVAVANRLDDLPGARFAGVTTFPALLFDPATRTVRPTANLTTLERAVTALTDAGITPRVNAPGTTSASVLGILADHGATQVEPGHGLTASTPLHTTAELPERPALCYLSEVSHLHEGRAFAFGGGLYVDPVLPGYQVRALLAEDEDLDDAQVADAVLPAADAIDYYAQLDVGPHHAPSVGASVVFGFRAQAFVTRAQVAGISGVATDAPTVTGIWNPFGQEIAWPT